MFSCDKNASLSTIRELSAIPDRSRSDYYCEVCDSHMNSEAMWESHINGKRHIKNKKKPGQPSKIKSVARDDVPSHLKRLLMDVEEPVVGLGYMSELHRSEPGVDTTYSCFICSGQFTKSVVIEHVLSTKHRLSYLKIMDPDGYNALEQLKRDLTKDSLDILVQDKAAEWERRAGRGTVEVKVEKPKCIPSPSFYQVNKKPMKQQPSPASSSSYRTMTFSTKTELLKSVPTAVSRSSSATKDASNMPKRKSLSQYTPKTYHARSSTSTPNRATSSSHPDSPEPEPESPSSEEASQQKGIKDIDLIRDIGMCSTEMQLELLEYLLVTAPAPIETEEDLQEAIENLNEAKKALLKWRADRMSLKNQQKLVDDILLQREDPVYAKVFAPVTRVKKNDK